MNDKSRYTEGPFELIEADNMMIVGAGAEHIATINNYYGDATEAESRDLANAWLFEASFALLEALEGDEALISTCQSVLTNYMVPDGICADEAIADLISLLDGPQQREIQGASKTALASARGED